tara:strand:+ start:8253 stop:9095 length:843 start_codon:yes stop_codon:yes gene_type:complete
MELEKLNNICSQVRRDILRMVHANNSGHPGGSLGCVEYFVSLYFVLLKTKSQFDMNAIDEDVFILSNGHISPVYYSVMARKGLFDLKELSTFRSIDSRLQGHPTPHEGLEGVRIASGSLGQGMSVAIGSAITKKLNNEKNIIYSLHGDGELQEGQNWEAIMYASANKVDNIIATIDYNKKQIDGSTDDVLPLGNLKSKFESFGWKVLEEENGNNIESVISVLNKAKTHLFKNIPIVILLHTEMGNGVDFMVGTHKWHGSAPNDEQLALALSQNKETLGDY